MKEYIIEFTMSDGSVELVELKTDRLEWSIDQWKRNRAVSHHKVINENNSSGKQMLLG
jgi:hypothetical protein